MNKIRFRLSNIKKKQNEYIEMTKQYVSDWLNSISEKIVKNTFNNIYHLGNNYFVEECIDKNCLSLYKTNSYELEFSTTIQVSKWFATVDIPINKTFEKKIETKIFTAENPKEYRRLYNIIINLIN